MTDAARKDAPRSRVPTFPLRLTASLRTAMDRPARDEGTSANQFIAIAVVEKVSALATAEEFECLARAADHDAFDRIMNRTKEAPKDDADRL